MTDISLIPLIAMLSVLGIVVAESVSKRSQILRAYGLKVLRFSNRDVDRNLEGVCTQIDLEVKARL